MLFLLSVDTFRIFERDLPKIKSYKGTNFIKHCDKHQFKWPDVKYEW